MKAKYKSASITILFCIGFNVLAEAQIVEKADSLYKAGREAHQNSRLDESLGLYQRALDIYVSLDDSVSRVKTLNHLISVYWRLGRHEEGLHLAETGLDLARKLDDIESISMFLTDFGTIKSRQGYYDEAYDYFNHALETAYEAGDSSNISVVLNNFANLNRRMGNLSESIRQFELSLKLIEGSEDLLGKAITLNSLGVSYLSIGKLYQALQNFEHSLQLRLQASSQGDMAIIYNNLAMAHQHLGNYLLTLDYFGKSLQVYREKGNRYGSASTLRNIGLVHYKQNDFERAEYYYLQSHNIYTDFGEPSDISLSLKALGRLYAQKGAYKKALSYFDERLVLEKSTGNPKSVGDAYLDLGYYYNKVMDYDKALEFYLEAYERSKPVESRPQLITFLSNIGIAHAKLKEYEEAYDYLNRAFNISTSINPDFPDLTIAKELADLHYNLNSDRAFHYAELVYQVVEDQRVQIGAAGRAKADYFSAFAPFYNQVASWYLKEKNDIENAYRWIEAAKARAFIDDLAEASHKLDAHLSAAELDEKIKKTNRIIELSTQLEKTGEINENQLILQDLREAELDYAAFMSRIRLTNPAFSRFDYPDPVTLDQAGTYAESNTLILEYSFSDSELVSFAISENEVKGWTLQNPVMDGHENFYIDMLVSQFREAVKNKHPVSEIAESANALAHILLGPASEMLKKADKLIIVAEGMLAYLPFEALLWNNRYLIQDYQIKYSPSITALTLISEPAQDYSKDMLQIANPDFANTTLSPQKVSFSSLPSSMLEAESISGLFDKVTTLSGKEAQKSRIKSKDLTKYRYLHFATHGLLNEENPGLSGLVLAQSPGDFSTYYQEDGFLRSAEIYALSLNADIVVLSACETGLGKEVRGEGVLGLQRAFFHAGASTVVVSLWPVYDRSTSVLMTTFYRELINYDKKNNSWLSAFRNWMGWEGDIYGYKAAAMRDAKLALIDHPDYNHPVYWAPFIVVGK